MHLGRGGVHSLDLKVIGGICDGLQQLRRLSAEFEDLRDE